MAQDVASYLLPDGRSVSVRAATVEDVPAIAAFYRQLSAASYAARFLSGRPDDVVVHALAALGPVPGTHSRLVSWSDTPGAILGEARYVPTAPAVAELAVAVQDRLHGAGLGTILLDDLIAHARDHGVERLAATVSLRNTPMLRLLARRGWVLTDPTEDGTAFVEISTVGGMPGWPRDGSRRVLVETRGWFDAPPVGRRRVAGTTVRTCQGPSRRTGRPCPLVESGSCRVAEDADVIISLLPEDDQECRAVVDAQQRHGLPRSPHPDTGPRP